VEAEDTPAEEASAAAGPSHDGTSTQAEAEQEDTNMTEGGATQGDDDGAEDADD